MLKVGLTGSIAVGKSYVCEVLRELGAVVLDADRTAREVTARGSVGLRKITEDFGAQILTETGELDRVKMGALVFADERKRQLLNSIVHPLVHETQAKWLEDCERENRNAIAVIDAALMIESQGYKRFTKIIVVWCDFEIQLKRLQARNNLTEAEAFQRINAQMPQDEKKKFADFLIDTSKEFEDTRRQTVEIFRQLRLLV